MTKKLITKRIQDLTETDKAQYLSYIKESFSTNYNTDWSSLEPHIQATIDTIFDDELFADFVTQETVRDSNSPRGENHRVNPRENHRGENPRIRAAMQAREYFHYRKPSLVDYLIFGKVLESGESRVGYGFLVGAITFNPFNPFNPFSCDAGFLCFKNGNNRPKYFSRRGGKEERQGERSGGVCFSLPSGQRPFL